MPVLLLILLIGVMLYFVWRHRTSSLSRNCRWREDRRADQHGLRRFYCMYCGAKQDLPIGETPRICARQRL